jgi:hypothetical protein
MEGPTLSYADSAALLSRTLRTLAVIGTPLTWALTAASAILFALCATR